MRSSKNTFSTGALRLRQELWDGQAGMRLPFGGGDFDFECAWKFVPLHAPDWSQAIGFGGDGLDLFGMLEDAGGTAIGKLETDGGVTYRLAALVADLDGDAARGARTRGIGGVVAFGDAQLDSDGRRRVGGERGRG